MTHRALSVCAAVFVLGCAPDLAASADSHHGDGKGVAALPREYVDTTLSPPTGRTIAVPAGGDLQDAIDGARPGDEIVLEPGGVYKGPFTLPNKKEGAGWIIVRSGAAGKEFPGPGTRVQPTHAAKMATLVSRRGSVIIAEPRAHHFRFIGLEIRPSDGAYLREIVQLGDNSARVVEDLPHHIIVDRCFIHGDPVRGSRRGVFMNGRHLALIDSYVTDIKEVGQDSQAVGGYAGTGPFKVVNNYLAGAGENILFGGGDPSIRDLIPSDIEVRRNTVVKPLSWKPGEPDYEGQKWQVKILFELKSARRVLVEGNVFENNWLMPGYGYAITLTVRNENGQSPWAAIEDVTVANNIIRHSPNGVNILGLDDMHPPSGRAQRIVIRNNVFDDINGARWGGKGRLFQLLRGTRDVVIEHNVGFHTGHVLMVDGEPHEGFVYRYNITPHNEFGMEGAGTGVGKPTFERHLPGAVVTGNVLIGGGSYADRYPEGNTFPESIEAVPFLNPGGGDYRLASSVSSGAAMKAREVPGIDAQALCASLGDIGRLQPMCQREGGDEIHSKPRAVEARH